jgi:hypothetical protein
VRPGDDVVVDSRPAHGIDVPTLFRALMGDVVVAGRVLEAYGEAGIADEVGVADAIGEKDVAALRRLLARQHPTP